MTNQEQESTPSKCRYENAQMVLQGFLTNKMVANATVNPTWLGETDCFWYTRDVEGGKEFRWVDVQATTNKLAFDHQVFASSLSDATGEEVDACNLPLSDIKMAVDISEITFHAFDKDWLFDIQYQRLNMYHWLFNL